MLEYKKGLVVFERLDLCSRSMFTPCERCEVTRGAQPADDERLTTARREDGRHGKTEGRTEDGRPDGRRKTGRKTEDGRRTRTGADGSGREKTEDGRRDGRTEDWP